MFRWSFNWFFTDRRPALASLPETPDGFYRSEGLHPFPLVDRLDFISPLAVRDSSWAPTTSREQFHNLPPDLQCNWTSLICNVLVTFQCQLCGAVFQSSHLQRLLCLHGLKGVSECHVVGTELWRWFSRFLLKPNIHFMPAWLFSLYLKSIAVWTGYLVFWLVPSVIAVKFF